jgi:hypothetical protein
MSFLDRVRPFLGYRTLPTTALLVLIYLIAFTAISVTDQLASVPHTGSKKLQWLDLNLARRDLEHVRAVKHVHSRSN